MESSYSNKIAEKYFELIDKDITRKGNGFPSKTLHIWLVNINVILLLIFYKGFVFLDSISSTLMYLAIIVFIYIFGYIPRSFFDDKSRTTRRIKSKYPNVWKTLQKLVQKSNGEVLNNAFQGLIINKKKYFLVMYGIRQKWWEIKIRADISGWALIDENGVLYESADLFIKAFLTLQYAFIGAMRIQGIDEAEAQKIKETYKVFIPRAIKYLRIQKKIFEENGLLEPLKTLLDKLPTLFKANEGIITIYRAREKMAKAMGYSFGYEFKYEDALRDEEISRTFSLYMTQTYLQEIRNIDELLIRLLDTIKITEKWSRRKLTLWSIKTIHKGCKNVYDAIKRYSKNGIPDKSDWDLYVNRTDNAKQLGLTVKTDSSFSHAYPYEKCVYHDDFLKSEEISSSQ